MFKYTKGIRLIYIIVCWVHLSNIIYEIIAYLSCQTLFFKVLKCLLGLWQTDDLSKGVPLLPNGRWERPQYPSKRRQGRQVSVVDGWTTTFSCDIWLSGSCVGLVVVCLLYLNTCFTSNNVHCKRTKTQTYLLQQLVPGHRNQLLQHGFDRGNRGVESCELFVYLVGVVLISAVRCHFPVN